MLILFDFLLRLASLLPQYCEFARYILTDFSAHLRSPAFAQMARSPDHPQAFSRTRKLPLPTLVCALLSELSRRQRAKRVRCFPVWPGLW
ncbi:MAG TPA: hypothetical protein PKD73_07760, partial [Burkholderiaceae bacterium]|nr:hypothetical protein [Burkholderiaceae bacterium]